MLTIGIATGILVGVMLTVITSLVWRSPDSAAAIEAVATVGLLVVAAVALAADA